MLRHGVLQSEPIWALLWFKHIIPGDLLNKTSMEPFCSCFSTSLTTAVSEKGLSGALLQLAGLLWVCGQGCRSYWAPLSTGTFRENLSGVHILSAKNVTVKCGFFFFFFLSKSRIRKEMWWGREPCRKTKEGSCEIHGEQNLSKPGRTTLPFSFINQVPEWNV